MRQQSFTNTITIDQTPEQVFDAINNPRAWWNENITGITDERGAVFHYAYRNVHTCDILVEEITPSKVVWHVVDNHFDFIQDDSEWTNTRIVFDIARQGEKTVLTFTHVGLVPDYECFELCQKAWTFFTGDSLYKLITTGKGDPVEMAEALVAPAPQEEQKSLTLSFVVDQNPREVFEAINNVRGWWSGEPGVVGNAEKVGDEFTYRYDPYQYSKQRVTELVPGKRVVWRVVESQLNFVENKHEWTDTEVVFDVCEKEGKTELRFSHLGLSPACECFNGCSSAWNSYVNGSLKSLIATGTGM